jgi:hypothetical protein
MKAKKGVRQMSDVEANKLIDQKRIMQIKKDKNPIPLPDHEDLPYFIETNEKYIMSGKQIEQMVTDWRPFTANDMLTIPAAFFLKIMNEWEVMSGSELKDNDDKMISWLIGKLIENPDLIIELATKVKESGLTGYELRLMDDIKRAIKNIDIPF